MSIRQPKRAQRLGSRTCSGDQKTLVKRMQVETPIKAVAEGSQVARRIILDIESMEASKQNGLEIVEHGVHRLELGQLPRFSSSYDFRVMRAVRLGDRTEPGQALEDTVLSKAR